MTAQTGALDTQTLENFDAGGGRGNAANRRFCCPLCGTDKPRDVAHRCLSVDRRGLWNCKRCGETGKLRDFWEQRDGAATGTNWRRASAQQRRAQLSQLDDDRAPSDVTAPSATTGTDWRAHLQNIEPLAGTPGADYLASRGIPLEVAQLARVRFCANWMQSEKWRGAPAVVFSIRDNAGNLVAAQGRRIEPASGPSALTTGPKSRGAFAAPAQVAGAVFEPFDARGPGVIITEAPIDALSLATCGFSAVALCGINGSATTGPPWLRLACGLKSVYLAFDADDAGDDGAAALAAKLATYGARCERLRPETGKDWNEALQASGRDNLADWLASRVLMSPDDRAQLDAAQFQGEMSENVSQ